MAWAASLQSLEPDVSDTERVEQLRGLEELSCAIAAAQAQISVALDASVRSEHERRGIARDEVGRGAVAQIALARRISPARATRQLSVAQAIVNDMPHAFAAAARKAAAELDPKSVVERARRAESERSVTCHRRSPLAWSGDGRHVRRPGPGGRYKPIRSARGHRRTGDARHDVLRPR